jgi:hypothetical protein
MILGDTERPESDPQDNDRKPNLPSNRELSQITWLSMLTLQYNRRVG